MSGFDNYCFLTVLPTWVMSSSLTAGIHSSVRRSHPGITCSPLPHSSASQTWLRIKSSWEDFYKTADSQVPFWSFEPGLLSMGLGHGHFSKVLWVIPKWSDAGETLPWGTLPFMAEGGGGPLLYPDGCLFKSEPCRDNGQRVHNAKHCHRHVGRDIQTSLSGDSLPQSHLQWWFCALGHLRDRKGLELVRQKHFILAFKALFRMLVVLAKLENTIDSLLTMWHTKCYPAILVSWGCCNKIAWTR